MQCQDQVGNSADFRGIGPEGSCEFSSEFSLILFQLEVEEFSEEDGRHVDEGLDIGILHRCGMTNQRAPPSVIFSNEAPAAPPCYC